MERRLNNMIKFKEMVSSLPNLDDLLIKAECGKAEYRTTAENGSVSTAGAIALLYEQSVAVMRFLMKKGDSIERHQHAEAEAIIVITGSFTTYINGVERVVGPGQAVYYAPEDEHHGTVIEDLDCICVSVPRATGYPNGNK